MSDEDEVEKYKVYHEGKLVGEIEKTLDRDKDYRAGIELLKARGLHRKASKIDVMYYQARSFAEVSRTLYDTNLKKQTWDQLDVAPFAVNSCFAMEIYLKVIGELFGGKSCKTHDLLRLFSRLPDEAKSVLENSFSTFQSEKGLSDQISASTCLLAHRKVFETWRYLYEKERAPEVRIAHVVAFLTVCDRVFRSKYEQLKKGVE